MSLRIAIIGAGMAGVSAGRLLADRGHRVTLLEKSRGCGGRCATKRWEGHIVDHGAQYFTLRHLDFSAAVQQTCGEALCRITAPVLDEQGAPLPDTVRYYHREGNSRVVRSMAAGLTLRTETTVTDVRALLEEYDCVLSTAPLPQTAALFGHTISAEYIPCLTVLLAYRGEPTGLCREAYALSDHTSDLAWSACENHKAGRIGAGCTVMVAQMSETPQSQASRVAARGLPGARAWHGGAPLGSFFGQLPRRARSPLALCTSFQVPHRTQAARSLLFCRRRPRRLAR
jgi:hypothetical protein